MSWATERRHAEGPLFRAFRAAFGGCDPLRVVERWAAEIREREPNACAAFSSARRLGLDHEHVVLGAAGVLDERDEEKPRVLIGLEPDRGYPSPGHENFVLAHELGHRVLRERLRPHVGLDVFAVESPEEERLANRFAAEYLMPAREFGPASLQNFGDPFALLNLAHRYQVSVQACAIRGHELFRRARKVLVAVLWTAEGGVYAAHLKVRWSVPGQVALAGGVARIKEALRSDDETSGYQLIEVDGRKRRLWCRTTSLRSGYLDRLQPCRRDYLLTVGVSGATRQ